MCSMVEVFDVCKMEAVSDENNSTYGDRPNFAVVTLQDTDELMVTPSKWLNTDRTQCHWPPFRSAEKIMEAVRDSLEPSTAGQPWEMLKIVLHKEYETFKEAIKKQEELKAQKYSKYALITLQESNELTVIPTNWLKTQCYWPPFKTPEKCFKAAKNRLEPASGHSGWELLNVVFHGEYDTFKQAKEKQRAICEQIECRPSTSFGSSGKYNPKTQQTSCSIQTFGFKRKRVSSDITERPWMTTDLDPKKKAKQIMERIKEKVQAIQGKDPTITLMNNHILYAISKMNKVTRKKATIGIFGRTGEGKSSLLNAVLGEQFLLPSGGFGACTAVLIQVEANLNDDNYIAEIDLISKQEWVKELALPGKDDDNQFTEMIKERIAAVYGPDIEKKTLEELKGDDRYIEIYQALSDGGKIISSRDPSEFARTVSCYLDQRVANPDGCYWPLVKSVTIKIPKCAELLEHIVLIDIPETGACDKIRDDLWKTKIRECSSVWIVTDIKQAITDRDPWGIVEQCIEYLGPGGECKSINFICTKTDVIEPEEYLRSAKLTEAQIPRDGLDVKTKCILHRNDLAKKTIKHKLENSKSNKSKERFMTDVYTVSSTAYFDPESHLKSSETEIPKLRDIIINLNKSINRKLTRDYINEAKGISTLIQSVQQNKDKNMIQVIKDLQANLEKELKILDDHFEDLHENLKQCLSNGVEVSMRSCVKTTQDMLSSVRPKFERGFHRIFRAMCERGGFYWPRKWDEPLDFNKCLAKHMYDSINQEFVLMFPVDDNDKTEKSMQDKLEKFSIIQSFSPTSPMLHAITIFIQTQETKLKASLSRVIVEKKKEIYCTIYLTIKREMDPGYKRASLQKGEGSMQRMETVLIEMIEQLKHKMFNDAKMEVRELFMDLKRQIIKTLESELKRSVEHLLSQTSKTNLFDISRENQELEELTKQYPVLF